MSDDKLKTKRMGNAPIDVLRLSSVEALPTPGVEYRGVMFNLTTTGLENRVVTCLEKADGTFAWFEATFNEIIL